MKNINEFYNEVNEKLTVEGSHGLSDIAIDFNLQDLRQMMQKGKDVVVLASYVLNESKVAVMVMNGRTVIQCWANKSLYQIGVKVMALDSPFKITEIVDSGKEFEGHKIWTVKGEYLD